MLSLIFLIPLIFVVFLLVFFRKKTVWWEYLILVVPSIIISTAVYFGMINHSQSDTEYLGDYVTEIRYYEPWDEYIHKTCSYTTTSGSGKNAVTTTHYYDCSYVDYHSAKWEQVLSNGAKLSISEDEYKRLSSKWSINKEIFVDMKRRYHNKDGDMYFKKYDGIRLHSKTIVITNTYKNKIKASHSIFGFTNISPEDAKDIGLHDYPPLIKQPGSKSFWVNDVNQNPILGYTPTNEELIRWQFINGYYGPTKQFRVFVLFFYNEPQSITQEQRDYWEGGNKNEMILCIGLDSITKKIQWADAFSWSDKPTFEVNFRAYMANKDTLDMLKLADFVEVGAKNLWVRKNFEDFDYINVELTNKQLIWLFIIILLFNFGMTVYIIRNEFKH